MSTQVIFLVYPPQIPYQFTINLTISPLSFLFTVFGKSLLFLLLLFEFFHYSYLLSFSRFYFSFCYYYFVGLSSSLSSSSSFVILPVCECVGVCLSVWDDKSLQLITKTHFCRSLSSKFSIFFFSFFILFSTFLFIL